MAGRSTGAGDDQQASLGRPFALVPALVLAGIISLVLPLAIWLQDRYGTAGSMAATAAGALADVHGASVAMASLSDAGRVSVATAVTAIAAGLATNTLGKVTVAATVGGVRFAGALMLCLLPAVAWWQERCCSGREPVSPAAPVRHSAGPPRTSPARGRCKARGRPNVARHGRRTPLRRRRCATEPGHDLVGVGVHREVRRPDDLGPHRHVAPVDLDLPGALEQLAAAGAARPGSR